MDGEAAFDLEALLDLQGATLTPDAAAYWQAVLAALPLAASCRLAAVDPQTLEPVFALDGGATLEAPEPFWRDWLALRRPGSESSVVLEPTDDGTVRFCLVVCQHGGVFGYVVGQGPLYPSAATADGRCEFRDAETCRARLQAVVVQLERLTRCAIERREALEQAEARMRHKSNEVRVLSERYAEITRENIVQHERLRNTNLLLEERVRERTCELRKANNELEKQLTIIGDLQRSFLPSDFPPHPGYAWAPFYQASTEASGDYFDVIPIDDRRVGIVVADVCGHGAPAAVMMAMARILVRSRAAQFESPAQMLGFINDVLCREVGNFIFITMIYAILHTDTGRLHYSAAGHPPPCVLHGERGTVEDLPLAGDVPVNLSPGKAYEAKWYDLRPQDSIVFYTDGVTEVFNPEGEMFGDERLHELLGQCTRLPAAEVVARLVDSANDFAAHAALKDDFTLLVLQRSPD